MRKFLGIDPDMVYLDDWSGFEMQSEEFHESLEDLIDYIKDHGEFDIESGSEISIYTTPVRLIQYHFPTVNDDLEGKTPEEFINNVRGYIFDDIYHIHDGYIEVREQDYEIKGEAELKEAYTKFMENEDVEFLSKALEQFRKANEHLYYWSPDALQRKIHKFIYKEIDSLNCELVIFGQPELGNEYEMATALKPVILE